MTERVVGSKTPRPETPREALLGQLRYLLAEVEALGPLLGRLPADVLTLALPGERSVLETLAHLAALDREVHASQLAGEPTRGPQAVQAEPASTPKEDLSEALADVRSAREALVAGFEGEPEWPDALRDLALTIVHRDVAELKRLAHRLHESHITTRAIDLPK